MRMTNKHREELSEKGYTIIGGVFSDAEVDAILKVIEQADASSATFRKSADLFAIRQFLKEVPDARPHVFSDHLRSILTALFGKDFFAVKSIYFDKPAISNWFVSYHQDLTISVDRKVHLEGFGPWTVKQNQFAVQPPVAMLEAAFTVRIHLDSAEASNGALRIIPASHKKGIYRPETIDWNVEHEEVCEVPKGGVMIMRPLLLHASSRTTNSQRRRVVHIEFSNQRLPEPLRWSEQE